MLTISQDLKLPLDVVTEKLAFLGRTGSGKTYGATKLAELLLDAGAQIVALDPVGVWPGLRMKGSGPGFASVYIFGGLHGDFPLAPTGGALMADVIVDRGISAVLDVSQFIHAEQTRFAYDFATRFFQRKKAAPSAVHLFIEECQEFIPQNVGPGGNRGENFEGKMLHAFERLWKLGRNFGIGGSLISQRPQEVNKKALNQAGTLFVFQMTGPQEREAIKKWVAEQGIAENIDAVLPKLRVGEPHVWSPTFLNVSTTVRIAGKRTADVSTTPKVGARAREVPLTPIDRERLAADMAASVEKAKADDPRELRKRIGELERELRQARAAKPAAERVEVPVLSPTERKQIDGLARTMGSLNADFIRAMDKLRPTLEKIAQDANEQMRRAAEAMRPIVERVAAPACGLPPARPAPVATSRPTTRPERPRPLANGHDAGGEVGHGGLRRILIALAQRPNGLSAGQIGIRAGLSSRGGTFSTYVSRARTAGWIEGNAARFTITDAGLRALGSYDLLPTGRALLDHWLAELGQSGAARMLSALAEVYPRALSKDELGERAGIAATGGSFSTYVSRLRALELVEGKGELRASEELFG